MRRLLSAAFLLLLVGLATYAGSFYAARSVLAHGQHCGAGSNPACNWDNDQEPLLHPQRYWAQQKGHPNYSDGYSNGLKGWIRAQNVNMLDPPTTSMLNCETIQTLPDSPGCDFMAQSIQMLSDRGADYATMGFTEGLMPTGDYIRTSPKLFRESQTSCLGYQFSELPTTSLHEGVQIYWKGGTGTCFGRTVYVWWYARGFGTDIGVAYMDSPNGNYRAFTEHFDNTHMEPNGVQCFGTNASCLQSTGYDLYLWTYSGQYWSPWDWTRPMSFLETGGYDHVMMEPYYSFKTLGVW